MANSKFPKTSVVRDKNPSRRGCQGQRPLVRVPLANILCIGDIESAIAQAVNDKRGDALIGKELGHRLFGGYKRFAGEIIGGVGLGGANIVFGQVRIVFENVLDWISRSEAPQDMFDRDPGANDDRLAQHDLRIAFDTGMRHFEKSFRQSAGEY